MRNSTENYVLYAKWIPYTYTITFDGNGNTSGSMSRFSYTYDDLTKKLPSNGFAKTKGKFIGWNTTWYGGGISFNNNCNLKQIIKRQFGNITLYAQWKNK